MDRGLSGQTAQRGTEPPETGACFCSNNYKQTQHQSVIPNVSLPTWSSEAPPPGPPGRWRCAAPGLSWWPQAGWHCCRPGSPRGALLRCPPGSVRETSEFLKQEDTVCDWGATRMAMPCDFFDGQVNPVKKSSSPRFPMGSWNCGQGPL